MCSRLSGKWRNYSTLDSFIHCEPIFTSLTWFSNPIFWHQRVNRHSSFFNLFQLVPFVYPSFQSRILRYDLYIKGRDGWSAFNTMISEIDLYFHRFFIAIFWALSCIKVQPNPLKHTSWILLNVFLRLRDCRGTNFVNFYFKLKSELHYRLVAQLKAECW